MNTFRSISFAVFLLTISLTASPGLAAESSPCERHLGVGLANQMNGERLRDLIGYLTGERTIAAGLTVTERQSEASREAVRWSLVRYLESMGFRPEFESFHGGANVVVEIPGTEQPGEILELGAHFDSVETGADDNAAGVAVLVQLADLIKQTPPRKTVRMVFHDLEEVDGAGARHHALQIKHDPRRLIGVLLIDAIGYYPNGYNREVLSVETGSKPNNFELAQWIAKSGAGHGLNLSFETNRSPSTQADHGAYWEQGLPAILISRPYGEEFNHPYNHTRRDTASNMNWPYFLQAAKTIAAIVDATVNTSEFSAVTDGWTQPPSMMSEVRKPEPPPLRRPVPESFPGLEDPEVIDRHGGYMEGLKAAMTAAGVPKADSSKKRTATRIPVTPIAPSKKDQSGLKFPSSTLLSDYRYADEFIRSLLEAHEKMFPGAIRYDYLNFYTPLSRLSRVQQNLLKAFEQSPKFMQDWKAREPMTDFTITVKENTNSGPTKSLNRRSWDRIRSRWSDKVAYSIGYNAPPKAVATMLRRNVESVYRDRKRILFAASDSDFMRALALYIISSKLVDDGQQNPSQEQESLEDQLEELNTGALDYLKDEKIFGPLLEDLNIEDGAQWVRKAFDWIHDEIYTDSQSITLTQGQQLKIREVPPELAIFRGYVGNDCSTAFSPGFPFTPADRYYYVFDKDGRSLGYVGISLVTIEDQKTVFVHTIQGPDLTAAQTEMILRAFAEIAKPVFNSESAVLGPDRSIDANVNFYPISQTMMGAVAHQTPKKMKWWDEEYRGTIVRFDSTIEYDNPQRNNMGRKIEFSNPQMIQVEVTRHPFENKF